MTEENRPYQSDLKKREEAVKRRMLERLNRRAPGRQAEDDRTNDASADDTAEEHSEGAGNDD